MKQTVQKGGKAMDKSKSCPCCGRGPEKAEELTDQEMAEKMVGGND